MMYGVASFRQLPGDPAAPARAFWVRADDGPRLRLAHWSAAGKALGTILLFPGRTEYIEKYAGVAAFLNNGGYDVLSLDWRGQGMSDRLGRRGRLGHVLRFSDYQCDVAQVITAASNLDLPRPWHLLAHSMGGCIGFAALQDRLPVVSASFSAPMWGINLRHVPYTFAIRLANIAGRLGFGDHPAPTSGAHGTYVLDQRFATNLLTPDADEWARLGREARAWSDMTIGGASYTWVAEALRECARLTTLKSPDVAAFVGLGSQEQVVSVAAIRDRVNRWPQARLLEYPKSRHDIMSCRPQRRYAFLTATLNLFASAKDQRSG